MGNFGGTPTFHAILGSAKSIILGSTYRQTGRNSLMRERDVHPAVERAMRIVRIATKVFPSDSQVAGWM